MRCKCITHLKLEKMRIREVIKEKGMTTQEVADQMQISLSALNQSISGNPSIKVLRRIAEVVGCQLGEFFTDELEDESKNTITCPKCGAKFDFREDEK